MNPYGTEGMNRMIFILKTKFHGDFYFDSPPLKMHVTEVRKRQMWREAIQIVGFWKRENVVRANWVIPVMPTHAQSICAKKCTDWEFFHTDLTKSDQANFDLIRLYIFSQTVCRILHNACPKSDWPKNDRHPKTDEKTV